jgi:branched-chain amino acid transport system ATP-binding protein
MIDKAPYTGKHILEIRDLKKNFGNTEIIRGVNLSLNTGERHAIIGPNGAGKSTFFHLISARIQPSSGDVIFKDQSVSHLKSFEINRMGLSRSFQVTNIFHRMSVAENIRCSLLWSYGYKYSFFKFVDHLKEVNLKCEEILELIGLTARRETIASELSYAEQRSLEIGITVCGGADLILLDEPTAGMSNIETEFAIDLIKKVTKNKTLLMVEHDMSVVFKLADRISVLVYGQIIATGTPDEIHHNPLVREAYLGTHADAIA